MITLIVELKASGKILKSLFLFKRKNTSKKLGLLRSITHHNKGRDCHTLGGEKSPG